MTPEEYLAVPLAFTVEPVKAEDGRWRFRATYLELSGCTVESDFLTEAMDELDRRRAIVTLDLLATNREPPCPRPPVAFGVFHAREIIQSLSVPGGS